MNKMIFILGFMFMIPIMFDVAAAFGCTNSPSCPSNHASICSCQSTNTGTDCYIVYCSDTNLDGCYELDYNNKVKCPHECEMTGTYTAECKYEPKPCQDECIASGTYCVGEWVDVQGHTKNIESCQDTNGDGCLEIKSITPCSLFCTPNGGSSYCEYQQPPATCTDTCQVGQSRCFFAGQNEYKETCGNYDGDACLEYPSQTVPQGTLPTVGTAFCPFGCDEPQQDHAVCMIEPQKAKSTCSQGDTHCSGEGSYFLTCQYNPSKDYWDYYDENGNAYNVTNCGDNNVCIEPSTNKAYCQSITGSFVSIWDTFKNQNTTAQFPVTITSDGTYFWIYDFITYNGCTIDKYFINGTYISCFNTTGSLTSPTEYFNGNLYSLDFVGMNVNAYNDAGSYIGVLFNLVPSNNQSMDLTTNGVYFWVLDYNQQIYKYLFNGTLVDTYNINIKPRTNGVGFGIKYYDGYLWIAVENTQTNTHKIYKFTTEGTNTGIEFETATYNTYPSDIEFVNGLAYVVDAQYHQVYVYDLLGKIRHDACVKDSKKCSGDMYVNGRWIRPYLTYCGDWNNDTYMEWATTENGGQAYSCQYGCELNTTINDFTCRNNPPANCTSKEWKCVPDTAQCKNGWMEYCKAPYNDNCYTWVDQFACANGCSENGGCKSCTDQCSPTESKCFNIGDQFNYQSLSVPLIANCSYDANQECWVWSKTDIERCSFGCYENFSYDTNLSNAYCHTNETMENYLVPEFTGSVRDAMNEFGSLLGIAMPTDTIKYVFSFSAILIITGLVSWKSKGIKIGVLTFIVLTLFGSLTGWLPVWLTPVYVIIIGLYLMQKFWLNKGE